MCRDPVFELSVLDSFRIENAKNCRRRGRGVERDTVEAVASGGGRTQGAVDDGRGFRQVLCSWIRRNNVADLAVLS